MNTILKTILVLVIVLFTSCAKDSAKDEPTTTTTTVTDVRDKFIGSWIASEQSENPVVTTTQHTVSIAKSNNSVSEILINNFSNSNQPLVRVTVANNALAIIQNQTISTGTVVSGFGNYSATNQIALTYILNLTGIGKDSCTTTYVKQ